MRFTPEEMARLATPVPRYTSYPTAPHFTRGVTNATSREWLAVLPAGARISLYLHIPFCDTMCWFCGCHTRMVKKYEPVSGYLDTLAREIEAVAAAIPAGVSVAHVHWGGGSPTILSPTDVIRLNAAIHDAFPMERACEFAVEIDPRGFDPVRLDAFAEAGMTRASIGVQDFDPGVQKAINRFQSFEETRLAAEGLRERGVTSLNLDLLYGLPHQSADSMVSTLDQALRLAPDRIALFGYAHVPWMKKHQALIPEAALPGMAERVESAERAAARLVDEGYRRIGIDHFALPSDSLARAAESGTLRRNFQGYTADCADCLIGLGASAISQLPQGYLQNESGGQVYRRRIREEGLAVARGLAMTADDRLRADAIEQLMCYLALDLDALRAEHGALAETLLPEIEALLAEEEPEWFSTSGTGFSITETGRPFLRLIAARFDAYLPRAVARHSTAM